MEANSRLLAEGAVPVARRRMPDIRFLDNVTPTWSVGLERNFLFHHFTISPHVNVTDDDDVAASVATSMGVDGQLAQN